MSGLSPEVDVFIIFVQLAGNKKAVVALIVF